MPDYLSVEDLRAYLTQSMGKFDKAVAARRIKPNTATLAHSMLKGINDAIGGRFLPLAVDAVQIIRCKDCKFAARRAASVYPVVECMRPDVGYGAARGLDDYCSYGERKESQDDAIT